MDKTALRNEAPTSWQANSTISRLLRIIEESASNYDEENDSLLVRLLNQLRILGSNDVLPIGELPFATLESWPNRSTNLAVIIGNRRSHYLASHPELEGLEASLLLTLLDPDEVHSNRNDEMMAIVYRVHDPNFFLRIALLISEDESLQLSVISARLARRKEVEHGRNLGRLRWKK